jgi:hypothetical protein
MTTLADHRYWLLTVWTQAKDELISKLNKEKKHIQEVNSKAVEELAAADEKGAHLAMVKNKLEQTLDDLEVRSTLYYLQAICILTIGFVRPNLVETDGKYGSLYSLDV